MPQKLIYRQAKDGRGKVINPRWETICEMIPGPKYSRRAKIVVNEMLHAWNESFGKGLDVKTGLPPLPNREASKSHMYLVDGNTYHSIEAVEQYATCIGKRIILTQTRKNSNIYLVTLTK